MTRRLLPLASVVLVALVWGFVPFVSRAAGQGTTTAAQLVERMRQASQGYDFTGVVDIMWRDGNKVRSTSVDVTAVDGTYEVEAGSRRLVDEGGNTFVLGANGWTSVVMAPITASLPAPDHAWVLSTRAGPSIAGRPTTAVVASRRQAVVQRLFVDTTTGLLLGREVRDVDGRTRRSLEFTSITIGGGPRSLDQPGIKSHEAAPLHRVPAGYRAPRSPGGGYVLVSKARNPGGGVHLTYSDGLFTISVYEQRGELDWGGLAKGGTSETIAGHATRHYAEPGADVIVWEGDEVVYTCVSDAPSDVTAAMIAGFEPQGRSAMEKAVDFVLGPFGWH
jgi:sigma-E factor negative regulatory protein RseB